MLTRIAAWLSFIGLALWLLCTPLPSADLWWQLAGGRWICQHHALPRHDPFSFTAGEAPWLNHEWLAEIGMYGLMQLGGLGCLQAVRLLLVVATFLLLAWAARQAVEEAPSDWCLAVACSVALANSSWRYFFDVRPYLLTYLLLAATLGCGLAQWRGRALWSAWLLPPLFLLWANVHSGVAVGVAVLAVLCVAGEYRRRLLAVTTACLLATLCNPYGVDVLTFPFHFYQNTLWGHFLNEWAQPRDPLFWLYWLVTITLAGLLWRRFSRPYLGVLGMIALLSTTAWRHQPLFGLVSVPVWAAVGQWVVVHWPHDERRMGWVVGAAGLGLSCFVLHGTVFPAGRPSLQGLADLSLESTLFPGGAVRYLASRHDLPPHLYNSYGWGGYLSWYLYPQYQVCMDGRANTLYPEDVYRDFLLVRQADPRWHDILRRWDVHVMVLDNNVDLEPPPGPGHDIRLALQQDASWHKVYEDGLAVIYVEALSAPPRKQ